MSLQAPNESCTACKGDGIVYVKKPSNFFPGTVARVATICDCMRSAIAHVPDSQLVAVAAKGEQLQRELKRAKELPFKKGASA
jgi:hypothetical protein